MCTGTNARENLTLNRTLRTLKPTILKKSTFLVFLFFAGINLAYPQDPKSYFYENEFDVNFPVQGKWSMEVGVGSRGMLQDRAKGERISGYNHEHLELNHFTHFETRKSVVLSLGLRYRFKELFDSAETDEFRIIEQLALEPAHSAFSHRFRLEQRFKEEVVHRLRYELGFSHSMNSAFTFETSTEALYSVSTDLKPEAEQRFSVGIENSSFQNVDLGVSLEYRIENYALDPGHEFFLATGISLSL